ncbi:hypothetical protein, partial [Actinotalea ferrariae]|uniref:hypothetical protein n=1 Tax=Actinotalea ferrariae TaxID=1386098 RepID=UPI000558424A
GDGVEAELGRLDVLGVLTFGAATVEADDDVLVRAAPDDDAALADLLQVDLGAATPVAAGSEVAAVTGLDRSAPTLLAADAPAAAE